MNYETGIIGRGLMIVPMQTDRGLAGIFKGKKFGKNVVIVSYYWLVRYDFLHITCEVGYFGERNVEYSRNRHL